MEKQPVKRTQNLEVPKRVWVPREKARDVLMEVQHGNSNGIKKIQNEKGGQ